MATEVIMPALGVAQETGKLLRWMKAEGELVVEGEPLMEIETDKVTVEIEAPADGILGGVSASVGDDVPVGRTIAFILAEGEALSQAVAVGAEQTAVPSDGASAQPEPAPVEERPMAAQRERPTLASPKARRLAEQYGVPIEQIEGSHRYRPIQAADVLAFVASQSAPAQPAPLQGTALPTSRAWHVMAERMVSSWQQVPHFYLSRDCDATRLESWRDSMRKREGYEQLTHTDLLVKVCAAALQLHPRVNATWGPAGVETQDRINVGVAVATDDALIVPVVHDADHLSLREIVLRRRELVSRARGRNKLRPDDVSGGTFTISNLGMLGVDKFHAIVNSPQAAILAVGRILDRVVAIDDVPVVRPMLTLTLSFDHRVVDGAEGARFLDVLAALIEEPAGLVA